MLERTDFDDPGVVNQDVDLSEALKGLLDSGLNLGAVEQIALNRKHLAAAGSEFGFRVRKLFRIARENRNATALFAALARNLQAESARTACDKRDFIAE